MLGYLILLGVFLFILGAVLGSFLNVLIYRTVQGEPWVTGRSRCDHCRKKILWYDNIPLLSFLILRGQSRCCKKSIPFSYPVVEFMTGSLFVWWYWIGSVFFKLTVAPFSVLQPLFWLMVGVLLITIFFADLIHLIVPDLAVGILFFITIVYRLYLTAANIMQVKDLWAAILGMVITVIFFGSLWWLTKGRGMGLGDVKLVAPIALLLGWPKVIVGIFLSFILGGIVAVGLLVSGKRKMGQVIPFGPFIIIGTILSLAVGEAIFTWYLQWL
ncbi:prepilin peptidase [Patescibacteria group bacterium]|nr:prepilin peptidase [Patescibacteria group bacterium]MBU1967197.1 prepilin peptidase [Patescibacteria group bacterium]MBU2543011.1 prepilin peptidase [Patescibacteria group bacterium]